MNLLVFFGGLVMLSAATTLGYLLAAVLSINRVRDLEAAFLKLALVLQRLLNEIPEDVCGIMVLGEEDIRQLRRTLEETDHLAQVWTIEDYRR